MPYFVFNIHGTRILELVDAFDHYRDARRVVKELRSNLPAESNITSRLVFAGSEQQAQRLLLEKREARPLGEDA